MLLLLPWEQRDPLPGSLLTSLLFLGVACFHGQEIFGGHGAGHSRCPSLWPRLTAAFGVPRAGLWRARSAPRATSPGLQLPPAGHLGLLLPARPPGSRERSFFGDNFGHLFPNFGHLFPIAAGTIFPESPALKNLFKMPFPHQFYADMKDAGGKFFF